MTWSCVFPQHEDGCHCTEFLLDKPGAKRQVTLAWHKTDGNSPLPIGDCRKIVVLVDRDGMTWVGIRAYRHDLGEWHSGSEKESANVKYWMDLPELPVSKFNRFTVHERIR